MTNPDYDYTESLYIYRTCDLHHYIISKALDLGLYFNLLYGNTRDHTLVMDLNFLYSDFVMDDKEVLFHSAPGTVSSFHDDEGNMYCAVPAFRHSDADLARDPLSTNRRLVNTEELELFGTMVVAGATADHIKVLIPDTFSGPTVNANSPVVLQHVVGLTLGPAVDLTSSLPAPNLERALCNNSVLPTLNKRRGSYWSVDNPILQWWQNVNDTKCLVCDGLIRVNMSRHLRLSHTTCQFSGAALFRAARSGLHRNYMGKITWRRYINSQKDVVTHTMSVYANLALSGTDDVLSSIRGARPVRPYGWISHWHKRPARSSIMIVITAGPECGSLRSFFDYPLPGSRGLNTSFSCSPIRPNLHEYGTKFTSRPTGGHSSNVDASPTHLYFIYSYCSSRPETDAIVDPQQQVTQFSTDSARRGCTGPQFST